MIVTKHALACALLGALALGAHAQAAAPAVALGGASHEELKAAFLHCDRLATTEYFDGNAAASCSIVYEALKARVFGGDFERLMAWWRTQQRSAKGSAAAL